MPELLIARDEETVWDDLDLMPASYFTVHGQQLVWDGEGDAPFDWKLACPHIDDSFINRADRLRGLLPWLLNRTLTEHANTGKGWEPVRALVFFVRAYPILYTREQLARIAVGYERRRRVLRRERRLAAPSRVYKPGRPGQRKRRRG